MYGVQTREMSVCGSGRRSGVHVIDSLAFGAGFHHGLCMQSLRVRSGGGGGDQSISHRRFKGVLRVRVPGRAVHRTLAVLGAWAAARRHFCRCPCLRCPHDLR